jgi:OmpA-OmpF porin, OOP family
VATGKAICAPKKRGKYVESSSEQHSSSTATAVRETSRVREWIRLREPRWAFVPWGLLPLLGLLAVMLFGMTAFAHSSIESTVRDQTEAALRKEGYSGVKVAVSGQMVTLSGVLPAGSGADATEKVLALARTTTCPTWAGDATCAISVDGAFAAPGAPVQMPDYLFKQEAGVLRLTGEVPDQATRERVVALAQGLVGRSKITSVDDQLRIREVPVPEGYQAIVTRGVQTAARCLGGQSKLQAASFSLDCDVAADTEAQLRADAVLAFSGGQIGDVALRVAPAAAPVADTCDRDFAAALKNANIQFAVNSATIQAASAPLLDKLAAIAKRCPGTLRVEGHTDDRGALDGNMVLSRNRAEAVKVALAARGMDVSHMLAEGFGPNKPLDKSETDEGRARNRRIEIHMIRR